MFQSIIHNLIPVNICYFHDEKKQAEESLEIGLEAGWVNLCYFICHSPEVTMHIYDRAYSVVNVSTGLCQLPSRIFAMEAKVKNEKFL